MSVRIRFLITLVSALLGALSSADALACDSPNDQGYPLMGPAPEPKAPMRMQGACPFECCAYGEWIASEETKVYRKPHDKRVLDRMPPETKFLGLDGFVELTRLGAARAAKPVKLQSAEAGAVAGTMPQGTQVIVLDSLGEGFWRIWYAGQVHQLRIDNPESATESWFAEDPDAGLVLTEAPLGDWWARVRLPDGREGWLDMDDTPHLKQVDGCG